MQLVPELPATPEDLVEELVRALRYSSGVAVLTGAGISTESGIPDYRGPGTRSRARNPVQYREFVDSAEARRRYWARAVVGWPSMRDRRPNAAHQALAELEAGGWISAPITQNVDRLHHAAGSSEVIELHGALAEVRCLGCRRLFPREDVQQRMLQENPDFASRTAEMAPDGDAELGPEVIADFRPVPCAMCEGPLKPDVVFFGEAVPRPLVERAFARVDAADTLLVLGSSLAVYSGFRFARHAARTGRRLILIGHGENRAAELADLKIEARLGELLPRLRTLV